MADWVDFTQLRYIGYVALAMALGAIVGFERERADKPAGLRTHMLVAGSAALLILLGDPIVNKFDAEVKDSLVRTDPIRIVEAIITGISFLGAGTIIYHRSEKKVEGLTTASSILLAAGLGICVGLAQYTLAIGVTLLALAALRLVNRFEAWIDDKIL